MTEPSPFASASADLIALGYTTLPLIPASWMAHKGRGKAPAEYRSGAYQGMSKWQQYRDSAPSAFVLGMWMKWPDANIGVVMGTSAGRDLHLCALDFDAGDPDVLDTLLRAAPSSPMVKRGAKGETRFYLASKSLKTASYDDTREIGADGKVIAKRLIDRLTGFDTRQTVVPPSIHPDTMQPYVWLAGPIRAADLPVLTDEDIEALEEALEQCGWERAGVQRVNRTPRPAGDIDPDDIWSETKAAALANLSAWVPALDLYGCRPARGGYEAVETWRASTTGRNIADRKLNLSIQPDGIKDWGSNNTYSSIDLVMSARDCDQTEATAWLRERLGLDDDSVVIELGGRAPDPDHDLPEPLRRKASDMGASAARPAQPPISGGLQSAPKSAISTAVEAESPATTGFEVGAELSDQLSGNAGQLENTLNTVSSELPDHLTRVPGLVGEITDWICASARRPNRPFALGAALLLVGTAAGRKIAGPTGSGTHLYVLGLADTGSGKDHALNAIPTVMGAAGLHMHVGRGEFMSHQAVYRDLMRQPLTLCPMDEFGSFLKKVNNRNGAGSEKAITGVLRTAWGKSFSTMPSPGWATQGSDPIHSPAFSLFGAATDRDFYTAIDGGDVDNGFLNRFLLIATKTRPESRTPLVSRHDVPESISKALMAIYGVGGALMNATLHGNAANEPVLTLPFASPGVEKAFAEFENKMIRRATNEPLVARTAEMAIRLATIRALGMQGVSNPVVTHDDLEWGISICSWSTERLIADVAEHMAENPLQAETKRIQRLIRSRGRMKHRDLLRSLGGRLKSRELEDILKGLKDAEVIGIDKVTPPAGGPPTVWYSHLEDAA